MYVGTLYLCFFETIFFKIAVIIGEATVMRFDSEGNMLVGLLPAIPQRNM